MSDHLFPSEIHLENPSKDTLNRAEFANKVLNNILTKMELPNTIGIYGNWGSGKTTLLHFIKSKIQSDDALNQSIHIVHFQPWKYEYSKSSDLLFALLKEIQLGFNLKPQNESWIKLSALVLGMGGSILNNAISKMTFNIVNPLKAKKMMDKLEKELRDKRFEEFRAWNDKIQEVEGAFKKFIQDGLKKSKKEKLFIFIDDLDRCLPERAIHLLESIKNFLYQDRTLFIFALDHRVVSEMIEKKYGLHDGYGDEYLEKIINYHVTLPGADLKIIFQSLIDLHQIEIPEDGVQKIVDFLNKIYNEPRKAKRAINQFAMSKYFYTDFSSVTKGGWLLSLYILLALYLKQHFKKHFSNLSELSTKISHMQNIFVNRNDARSYQNIKIKDNSFTDTELSKIYSTIEAFEQSLGGSKQMDNLMLEEAFKFI